MLATTAMRDTITPPRPLHLTQSTRAYEIKKVLQLSADAGDTATFRACRKHYWRARPFSARRRHRLLSERRLPSFPIFSLAEDDDRDDLYRWEVQACLGFRLPEAFGLKSSLGGAGNLELSR